jgi:hypothetical protein
MAAPAAPEPLQGVDVKPPRREDRNAAGSPLLKTHCVDFPDLSQGFSRVVDPVFDHHNLKKRNSHADIRCENDENITEIGEHQ